MEFLLINHPLDCPICDQGGECELQDLAVGYGKDISRFSEGKRVVLDKNLGSLISTDMTRCIQCTRCVRFGQEIAGIMELGMVNRGEHSEIMTFMGQAVCSEVSGNVIDLCPVGALTSKPFRFKARSWEMQNHDGIAVHDTVGSNTIVQTLRGEVLRVLPRQNEEINEEWLSDRDRFSYTANNSEQRLTTPMLKINGEWKETDWQTALDNVASKLKKIVEEYGADSIGTLASPTSTLEEFALLAKLMRGLGSQNMDYRLRQQDFSADGAMSAPLLGDSIASLEQAKAVLLIGSNIRKEQPLLATRLRKAARNGASISAINNTKYDFAFPLKINLAVSPSVLLATLARLAVIVAQKKQVSISESVEELAESCGEDKELDGLAESLIEAGSDGQIIVGSMAQMDANYSLLVALATIIGNITEAKSGRLEEGNAAAAWQSSFLPFSNKDNKGKNASEMLDQALKACVLFNIEPSLDCKAGSKAVDRLREAGMVIHIGSYRSEEIEEIAHIMLPLAMVTESDGTHVNCEGNGQSWKAAIYPKGDARPGWKILRVMANYLDLDGFDYTTCESIRDENGQPGSLENGAGSIEVGSAAINEESKLACITHLPLYRVDAVTRRSQSLQQTLDNPPAAAGMHPETLASMKIEDGNTVELTNGDGKIDITVYTSASIPVDCVLLPTAMQETAALGNANWLEVKSRA
jgi:NADH-quinone oxidoreductase subunit G